MTAIKPPDAEPPGLVWGIKDSFLRYVGGVPDALCELFGGAVPDRPGRFCFPRTGRPDSYGGALTLTAYAGMLSVSVVDPEIRREDGSVRLVVGIGNGTRVAVADLRQTVPSGAGAIVYTATLTVDGSHWLGDVYPAGVALDAIETR